MQMLQDIWPSCLLVITTIFTIAFFELKPDSSGSVIAVLGDDANLRSVVRETDAWLLGDTDIPRGYLLHSAEPNFPERLRAAGATFVLRSDYAPMCTQSTQTENIS